MTFIATPADLIQDIARSTPRTTVPRHYETLEVELEAATATHWCHMNPAGRPCFAPAILRDLAAMQQALRDAFAEAPSSAPPARFHALTSRTPGVFNLGGDLTMFAEKIRAGDRAALRRYGEACIRTVHDNAIAYDLPLITVALVQGDALGGGFECALAFDVIVAEKRAKFGLPEIIFNLFPGMGAYSFLARRIGTVQAERMIMSGKIYTAEELHALGIVDVLAEDGEGEVAARRYITEANRKFNAMSAIFRTRRRVNPVTFEELSDVLDIWVDAAMALPETDLRKMQRLAAAQDRRMQQVAAHTYGLAAE